MTLMSLDIAPFEDPNALRRLAERAVDYLVRWQGQGEKPNLPNNAGPEIDRWRSVVGVSTPGRGSWCAVVQGAADLTAAIELGMILPWKTSPGAKRYVKNVRRAGVGRWACKAGPWPRRRLRWYMRPQEVPLGAYVVWDRGDPDRRGERWKGHIARFVELNAQMRMATLEGNRNNRTGDGGGAGRRRWSVVDMEERAPSEWKRRLAGIWVPW